MPLTVVRCGPCANAAKEYLKEIKQKHESGAENKLILLVPDQFSYIAEKRICDAVGGSGLGTVTVLTIHQLVRSLPDDNRLLSAVGKQMLIKKALMSLDKNNIFSHSKNKPGFISEILTTLNLWKNNCIDESEIKKSAAEVPTKLLSEKLDTMADIFSEYKSLVVQSDCIDDCDELKLAAEEIRKNPEYKNAHIWIDEFSEFSPMELDIISAFLEMNATVKVYLSFDDMYSDDEDNSFCIGAYYDLMQMCMQKGFSFSSDDCLMKKTMNEDLKFLSENYSSSRTYPNVSQSISLVLADDIYTETEYAAAKIIDLVKDDGYKFSDIAVMCGGLENYSSCIEAVFENYKIPYFSDYKVPLSGHPISILILSVFEMVERLKFPLKSVVRYIKTGYAANEQDNADMLCVYAQKHGIVGSMWLNPKYFEFEHSGIFDEAMGIEEKVAANAKRLEETRKKIILPLCAYEERSKGKKTIGEHIEAFFKYLTEINLFDKIEKRVKACSESGDENEASRLTHVWNILINIFDQMVYSIGDDKITRDEFAEYLKSGIESSDISIIPTVTNGVSVSDASRRSGSDVLALFIIGATADTVPRVKKEDGFFSDEELELVPILPKGAAKSGINRKAEHELRRALSQGTEKLFISCCKTNGEGNKTDKSPIFDLVTEKFPLCQKKYITNNDISNSVCAPEAMLHRLLIKLSAGETLSAIDECAIQWLQESEKYKNAFLLLNEAKLYSELKDSIPKNISRKLYESITRYSVSRLENYFKCPFSYFLNYGLHISEEKDGSIQSTDTGSLVHFAIAKFCSIIEDGAKTHEEKRTKWLTADKQKCDSIIDEIIEEIKSKTTLDARGDFLMERIKKTLTKAVQTTVISITKSKYSILSCELDFSGFTLKSRQSSVELGGIIDRLDTFSEDGHDYVRIIDYKTGSKQYSPENILNGIDIQLVIYAMAATELLDGNPEITGLFYNSLKKRVATGSSAEEAENKLKSSGKLIGSVYEDLTALNMLDIKSGKDMDIELKENGESSYLPLKLKKGDLYNMQSSNAASKQMLSKICDHVRDMVVTAADNIKDGDIRVYPFKNGSKTDSCKFCPFGTVCMFDIEKGAPINDGQRGKLLYKELKREEKH